MSNPAQPGHTNLPSRILKAMMGLVLMASGAFFVWYLQASWQKAREMDSWVSTPALVVSSEVEKWQFSEISTPEWEPLVRYRYDFEGTSQVADQIRRRGIRKAEYREAEAWAKRYPVGEEVQAWVNPENPAEAALKKDTKAALYSIWFPGLFVAGGLGIFISAFLPNRKRT